MSTCKICGKDILDCDITCAGQELRANAWEITRLKRYVSELEDQRTLLLSAEDTVMIRLASMLRDYYKIERGK